MNATNSGWILVDYDVHKSNKPGEKDTHLETYGIIYNHLYPVAMQFSESVYMTRLAHAVKIEAAFMKINSELVKRGLQPVTFNVTEVTGEKMDAVMRNRSINAHKGLVRQIAASLSARIERLEAKFNATTDDVEAHLYKTRLAVARAKRELDNARGLVLLFALEGETDVAVEIEASVKVIEAEADKRQMKKALAKAAGKAAAKLTADVPSVEFTEIEG